MAAANIAFAFHSCPDLPKLAWCFEIEDSSQLAHVFHGEWVTTGPEGFFEGAWAGDYAEGAFDRCFMTGTGLRRSAGGPLFVTPNHPLDRLNVLRKHGVLYVSNSLSFLLARCGEELDPDILFYDAYVSSIRYGLKKYQRAIRTRGGLSVRFFYCCNLTLSADRELIAAPKGPSPAFPQYRAYRAYLDDTILRVATNAADPRRAVRYAPLSTLSKGYDSPAVTVLAMRGGCREAFTFRESRGAAEGEDCGTTIAQRLGIACRDFGRLDYLNYADFPEIDNSGGPNEFLSFGEALAGRLVFTGFHGDKMWDRNCDKVTRDLVRGDASGSSLTEYRLRTGFCHLPVPFIGADRHPEIYAIGRSREMRPWTLGNLYDRPIARRIVEEAGVPRDLFGQKKRAAGVVVPREGLAATLSRESLADFTRFADERWNARKTLQVKLQQVVSLLAYLNRGGAKVAQRVAHALGLYRIGLPVMIPRRLDMLAKGYGGREALLFHWGVEKLIERYRSAMTFTAETDGDQSFEPHPLSSRAETTDRYRSSRRSA